MLKQSRSQTVEAVKKPVNTWRQTITAAGAIVAKPWRRYRASIFQSYLIGAIARLSCLGRAGENGRLFYVRRDDHARAADLQRGLVRRAHACFNAGSGSGRKPGLITLGILVFLYASGLKWETVVAFVSVVGSTALGLGIKVLVDRPRPSADLVNVITQLKDYSFPSGHVLFFITFFGFLLFLAYTLLKHSWWRTGLLIILVGMVALIGPSRIYVGQHWASDVIAAYLLGSVWLALSVLIYRWGKTRFFVNQPVAKETPVKGNVAMTSTESPSATPLPDWTPRQVITRNAGRFVGRDRLLARLSLSTGGRYHRLLRHRREHGHDTGRRLASASPAAPGTECHRDLPGAADRCSSALSFCWSRRSSSNCRQRSPKLRSTIGT